MFRWKAEASEADKAAVRDALAGMTEAIGVIRAYRFGDDAGVAEGNFDFAVVADFDDEAGYLEYAEHPEHQKLIRERLRPIIAERAAVQYRC